MILVGERLAKAWKDFSHRDPVHVSMITDDPDILAFLGDCHVYEVSREISDALLPLMHTEYTGRVEFNGTEYEFQGHIAEVEQLHIGGKRYWKFVSGVEELNSMLRIGKMIEAIIDFEQERWEKATAKK